MIVRRFGPVVNAVDPAFEAAAFNEIMFTRKPGFAMPWPDFAERYERVGELAIASESEGHVAIEAEEALLDLLAHRLAEADSALGPGDVLLIESQLGHDYPRTHDRAETLVEHGANRLHFHFHIDPPLRLGVWHRRG